MIETSILCFQNVQNGCQKRHKKWAVKIQHCPISSKFDMWVENDVPTLKNFYQSPFSTTFHMWVPEFIPDIEKFLAVTIFKMATKIQHCPISSKFDMLVDNDVPN